MNSAPLLEAPLDFLALGAYSNRVEAMQWAERVVGFHPVKPSDVRARGSLRGGIDAGSQTMRDASRNHGARDGRRL